MKHILIRVANVMSVSMILTGPTPLLADDAISHISLGHDSFSQAIPDPKAPTPSVISAKYGFGGEKGFSPYVGTGFAYTLLPEIKPGESFKFKAGVSAQVGANYQLGGGLSLSLDYKYLHVSPETQHGETPPQSIGIGVKIKF